MSLTKAHARAIIRLLADVAAHPGTHREKKCHLMEQLCSLIHADAWVWSLGTRSEADVPQAYAGLMHGGFEDEQWVRFLEAVEHPDSIKAAARFYERAFVSREHVTMDQHEMDPDMWAQRGELGQRWQAVGFGPSMLSGVYVDEASMSVTGLYRKTGRPDFNQREKQIVHLILSGVYWIHLLRWPENLGADVSRLSPRQRLVLNLLLEGCSRKHIAADLGITEGTVSNYAKEVYRIFEVNSHPELMRKFLGGSGDCHAA